MGDEVWTAQVAVERQVLCDRELAAAHRQCPLAITPLSWPPAAIPCLEQPERCNTAMHNKTYQAQIQLPHLKWRSPFPAGWAAFVEAAPRREPLLQGWGVGVEGRRVGVWERVLGTT